MVAKTKTKSQLVADDVTALSKARTPLFWIVTQEESRVEKYLFQAAIAAKLLPRTWDCGQGVCDMNGEADASIGGTEAEQVLDAIRERAMTGAGERGMWILRDLPGHMVGPLYLSNLRRLRNLARLLPGLPLDKQQNIVVLSPSGEVPPELQGHATVIEWPLPDRTEIAGILDDCLDVLPAEMKAAAAPNGQREAAIDAAVGLNSEEAAACYSKSLVQTKKIDPAVVAAEKKRVIAKAKVLEWFDPLPGGLDSVGGLDGLKGWLTAHSVAYSAAARAYGLPAPKGLLLVGVPGCGKSLTAKAIATAYGIPLLRLDLGALKSKFVGESEANFRKALATIEACGRVVVWLDEIEKALSGATQGAADGGVSADALGSLLSWMQDKAGDSFVIATANNVEALPPELLRKGRFDDVFFVDLPNVSEREAILSVALKKHGRKAVIDVAKVAAVTDTFTGSEVAELVPEAMFTAFSDNAREITTDDLLAAAAVTVPLNKTAGAKITALRDWAKGRARPASLAVDSAATRKPARALDLG